MKSSNEGEKTPRRSGFDSANVIDIVLDGPSKPITPLTPEEKQQRREAMERYRRYLELRHHMDRLPPVPQEEEKS